MPKSVEQQVQNAISNFKRGKIFFPADFTKFGSATAVRQSLNRLEKKGVLIRLTHGIYLYPKTHEQLGILYPSIEDIAIAIAKRDKARLIPTGIQALNKLGLSNQTPMNSIFLTDGSSRTIKFNGKSIKFKKASPKTLTIKSEINLLIIQALREIGQKNLDDKIRNKIDELLKTSSADLIKHDLKLAPVWIAQMMKNYLNTMSTNGMV